MPLDGTLARCMNIARCRMPHITRHHTIFRRVSPRFYRLPLPVVSTRGPFSVFLWLPHARTVWQHATSAHLYTRTRPHYATRATFTVLDTCDTLLVMV